MADREGEALSDYDSINNESFYVYRSLHSDESWGAVLLGSSIIALPNIEFGMRVFAKNEKEAVARARDLYERHHRFDTKRKNVKEFMTTILGSMPTIYYNDLNIPLIEEVINNTLKMSIKADEAYSKYFKELEEERECTQDE